MGRLFTQLGDAILQKVAPVQTAEAVCITNYQYRCESSTRCRAEPQTTGNRQRRACYTGSCPPSCTAWADNGCC